MENDISGAQSTRTASPTPRPTPHARSLALSVSSSAECKMECEIVQTIKNITCELNTSPRKPIAHLAQFSFGHCGTPLAISSVVLKNLYLNPIYSVYD